ncbi:nuclear receptor-interacting protein 2 [Electrophorus electricus]|uniref:Aspartic peptidase DDI1-type domain-containing protein n=1 Tax=Electrophorus electricus TaxID=8005 RepID=A0AAY5EPA9_ELEEL|nr:nuclear receptor-interacting protein 2 [Electrophorus electricus]
MSEPRKSETDLRDKAIMHQQRRLKQATQFTHKDSADLLPLDGLKRLGTSKDLQPHSIVQRRLLEGNIPRLRREAPDAPAHVRSPLVDSKDLGETEEKSESTVDDSAEERESPEESERSLRSEEEEEEEEDEEEEEEELKQKQGEQTEREGEHQRASALSALMVQCKCGDAEVKVSVNTGSQHNQISTTCCRRLGLKASLKSKALCEVSPILLQFGKQRVECAAQVVEDEASELCLGLQTLLELKCCVDLNTRVLRLHGSGEELPFLETPACSQCHRHDNNKNL